MIIIYKEISYSINQICSGHNCLVIPVSPQFPDAPTQELWIRACTLWAFRLGEVDVDVDDATEDILHG